MTHSFLAMSLACTSAVLLLGATMGVAEALPVQSSSIALHHIHGAEQVMYRMHRKSRHTHHNAPNKYCRSQPSRC